MTTTLPPPSRRQSCPRRSMFEVHFRLKGLSDFIFFFFVIGPHITARFAYPQVYKKKLNALRCFTTPFYSEHYGWSMRPNTTIERSTFACIKHVPGIDNNRPNTETSNIIIKVTFNITWQLWTQKPEACHLKFKVSLKIQYAFQCSEVRLSLCKRALPLQAVLGVFEVPDYLSPQFQLQYIVCLHLTFCSERLQVRTGKVSLIYASWLTLKRIFSSFCGLYPEALQTFFVTLHLKVSFHIYILLSVTECSVNASVVDFQEIYLNFNCFKSKCYVVCQLRKIEAINFRCFDIMHLQLK